MILARTSKASCTPVPCHLRWYSLYHPRSKHHTVSPLQLAKAYAIANNPSKAMDWLEKGYEDHDANMPYIGLNWMSNGPYKIDDPRLIELLKKMNLPLPKD